MLDNLKSNAVYIILGALALNIFVLDYFVFIGKPRQVIQNINLGSTGSGSSLQPISESGSGSQTTASVPACPAACVAAINTATSSLKLTPTIVAPTTPPAQATTQTVTTTGGSNEYFVPFGAGSAASQGSYSNVPGMQAYVNMSQYNSVQSVVFEVSVGAGGIVQLQLYDVTDGYIVPGSNISMPGGNPQLIISSPLTMPSGNKLYQVQVQTQLDNPATINSARLHITTK